MRVTTAYNRMLGLPGAWVRDVAFDERAMIVTVCLRGKTPMCSGCGDLPEMVEWARGGAPHTRDFDDLSAWLAQQMNQTQIDLAQVVAREAGAGRAEGAFPASHGVTLTNWEPF